MLGNICLTRARSAFCGEFGGRPAPWNPGWAKLLTKDGYNAAMQAVGLRSTPIAIAVLPPTITEYTAPNTAPASDDSHVVIIVIIVVIVVVVGSAAVFVYKRNQETANQDMKERGVNMFKEEPAVVPTMGGVPEPKSDNVVQL